jgi:TetR/AcrR family transcriptional repressor of nem operon
MRISKEQAEENRTRIADTASRLYRERGFEGIGLAELMKAAGLTHGALYNHFGSKEALAVEALTRAFDEMSKERARFGDLAELFASYLSSGSRAHPGLSCPAAALGADVGRGDDQLKTVFASGLEEMIESLEARLRAEGVQPGADLRHLAVNLTAKLAGALMLARAVPRDNPLSREIARQCLEGALADLRGGGTAP